MIKIYTDGSCLSNPGNGGWAAIINMNGEIKKLVEMKKIRQITEWNLWLQLMP